MNWSGGIHHVNGVNKPSLSLLLCVLLHLMYCAIVNQLLANVDERNEGMCQSRGGGPFQLALYLYCVH